MFSFLAVFTSNRWVHIIMPKFKISSKINLKKMLPKMGISNVFTTAANFSGITEENFPAIFEVSRATYRVSVLSTTVLNEKPILKSSYKSWVPWLLRFFGHSDIRKQWHQALLEALAVVMNKPKS